jgi:hypothetical protein
MARGENGLDPDSPPDYCPTMTWSAFACHRNVATARPEYSLCNREGEISGASGITLTVVPRIR